MTLTDSTTTAAAGAQPPFDTAPPAASQPITQPRDATGHPAQPHPGAGVGRDLSELERASVAAVAVAVGLLGLLGFVNSFAAVYAAARPSFGWFAWTVPLGIDVGIAVFSALDITLARLNMRLRWLRLIPASLVAATIYLNVASAHGLLGQVAHAVLPALWVVVVEVGAHVVRVRAGVAAGTRMDRIRGSRWLLAPVRTLLLWRRMVLWELRSYPDALTRERNRLLALTDLQDTYGPLAWRWKAPRRSRALYKLGELAPARDLPALPAPETDRETDRNGDETGDRSPRRTKTATRTRPRRSARPAGRSAGRSGTNGRRSRAVRDSDDLLPLGRRVAADLYDRGEPLTRVTLAAALRDAGQGVSNERLGSLLTRLKTENRNGDAGLGPTGPVRAAGVDGGESR